MKTHVTRDGEDYILNGHKTFITNGPYADVLVVYAKLADGEPASDWRNRPVLVFVLDAGMPGLTQGKPFKKMGMMSSPTGELFFDNVRLTPDRLLCAEGTAATAPAPISPSNASAWRSCRWASSTNATGCVWITQRPARCGAVTSGSSN